MEARSAQARVDGDRQAELGTDLEICIRGCDHHLVAAGDIGLGAAEHLPRPGHVLQRGERRYNDQDQLRAHRSRYGLCPPASAVTRTNAGQILPAGCPGTAPAAASFLAVVSERARPTTSCP